MTQGLEQYHLTHLKISLIYLLNLRYKVLDREFLNLRTCISLNIKLECSSYKNKKTYITRPDPKFFISLIMGAGISLKAGMPTTKDITECVLYGINKNNTLGTNGVRSKRAVAQILT